MWKWYQMITVVYFVRFSFVHIGGLLLKIRIAFLEITTNSTI